MARSPTVSRKKYRRDLLVPISGERVAAGIELRGFSVRDAAKRLQEKQQTLDAIVQGGTRRCRASRRRRLSRLLRLSEDWLAGEDDPPLPGLPPWLPSATAVQIPWPDSWRLSSDLEPTLDENLALYRPGAAPGFDPPRYQLEWGYLAERVIEAWKRDIEAGSQEALQAIGRLQPGVLGEENWLWVIRCVARGLGLVWWRYRALTRSPAPDVPPGTWI